jgi:hypothetical protein
VEIFGSVMANGRPQIFQVAARPAGIAAYFDIFFTRRGRNLRQHPSTPKGIQARYAPLELLAVRLFIAAIGEVDRQHVRDVDPLNIARLAGRAVLVGDIVG